MKSILTLSIASFAVMAILTVQSVLAQPPDIEWDRLYGGNNSDEAYSVQQTTDGGYIFAGYTKSFGADSNDVYLVKADSLGNMQWYRMFGGADYDAAESIQQTTDGGYILVGRTSSFGHGSSDVYLIKTNDNGDSVWTKTYGGESADAGHYVQQTRDGGYIIAGRTTASYSDPYDIYLIKTDELGDTLWTRTYGGTDDRAAYCVQQTFDCGYILVGWNPRYGGEEYDIYVVKTDSLGDSLWSRSYGGNGEERAVYIQHTTDRGYIIAGSTDSFGAGGHDVYIVKIDSVGEILWSRTYGGSEGDYAQSASMIQDDGYIIAGITSSFGAGESSLYLVRINSTGDTLWTQYYGDENYDFGFSIDQTTDRGYIIAGSIWNWELPADAWLVKTGPDTSATHAPSIEWVSHPLDFALHPAYPNPFNPSTVLTYSIPSPTKTTVGIYNVLGERVATLWNGVQDAGIHTILWNAADCASGLYFCRIEANHRSATRKLVLLK